VDGQLKCYLEIVNYTFHCLPVLLALGVDMAAEGIHSKGVVGLCGQGYVAEASNSRVVQELEVFTVHLLKLYP
jgi:hypothetical protein